MKKYMVHIWGGAFNDDADPSIKKNLGITGGYYYFDTKREKDAFITLISASKYKKQGLMIDVKHGTMSHKRTIFVGTFEYSGNRFVVHKDFGYEYSEEDAEFMFTLGNYSCDCNRSMFIRREYGEDSMPELGCGCEITLLDYHFEYYD